MHISDIIVNVLKLILPNFLSDRPDGPGLTDTFVLYIDGVDNIPDNATITKVSNE